MERFAPRDSFDRATVLTDGGYRYSVVRPSSLLLTSFFFFWLAGWKLTSSDRSF